MQPFNWYLQRLRGMSFGEIIWRIQSMIRDITDRYRFLFGLYPCGPRIDEIYKKNKGFNISDVHLGEWISSDAHPDETKWCNILINKANKIKNHQLTFFDLKDCDLGHPIDWNCDHSIGKKVPIIYSPSIDYRDVHLVGDCKLVWEPNRHHHLVVLGRAYRATGDKQYVLAIIEQLESWIKQNPFGKGINWRSPLELGIRLINWVWTIDLVRDSDCLSKEFLDSLYNSIYLHCWEITRKYSRGSSANNHLVGEAAGIFIATSYFAWLPNADKWRQESLFILENEIRAQTYPDGCTREQALGYQFFVIQFYLISGLVGRWISKEYSKGYWKLLENMVEFVSTLDEGGECLPMFGDRDDGYVLDLGSNPEDTKSLLAIAAILFNRTDFANQASTYSEPARWLLGKKGRNQFQSLKSPKEQNLSLQSKAFPDAGYYLLQSGNRGTVDEISVFFDCGELGFGSIAAHGHADALSFNLRVNGIDVLVDPGTYDYFTYPTWRNYFRSSRAHNTLVVDDVDQSEILGPFLWGKKARSRCVQWHDKSPVCKVIGEHDGYSRLNDPVIHRRTLELDGKTNFITILDEVISQGPHKIVIYFHFSEYSILNKLNEYTYEAVIVSNKIVFEFDSSLSIEILFGSMEPIGGWLSRGYHHKVKSNTLRAQANIEGNSTFLNRISLLK